MKYRLEAIVEKSSLDTMKLIVNAETEEEALIIGQQVVERFPRGHDSTGVPFCFVSERRHQTPRIHDISIAKEVP